MRIRLHALPFIVLFIAGFLLSPVFSQKLDISVKTESYGGFKAPRHAIAFWIQTPETKLVHTIEVFSWQYNWPLMNWRTITGLYLSGEYDALCQATVPNHEDTIKVVWDCKDSGGTLVPRGTYEFCAEFTEQEYYYKTKDSNEVYTGKYSKGTIVLDGVGKIAYGDTSDRSFTTFTATYSPDAGIVLQGQNPGTSTFFTHRYIPEMQKVFIKLNTQFDRPAILYITTLKGELLEKITLGPGSREYQWNVGGGSGKNISSGVYQLYVDATGSGNQLRKGYSITLLK